MAHLVLCSWFHQMINVIEPRIAGMVRIGPCSVYLKFYLKENISKCLPEGHKSFKSGFKICKNVHNNEMLWFN